MLVFPTQNKVSQKKHTYVKLRLANTCENTTKKQLYQVKYKKEEIGLELAKILLPVELESVT